LLSSGAAHGARRTAMPTRMDMHGRFFALGNGAIRLRESGVSQTSGPYTIALYVWPTGFHRTYYVRTVLFPFYTRMDTHFSIFFWKHHIT
jgi:hypothetical protein